MSEAEELKRLREYARKMSDPNKSFYVSHTKLVAGQKVHVIKDIQQMAKDAQEALNPWKNRKGFFDRIHVYYGPEWDQDGQLSEEGYKALQADEE